MKTPKLDLIKKDIEQLADVIMKESYPYCETENLHLSIASGKINDAAHQIKKIIQQINGFNV